MDPQYTIASKMIREANSIVALSGAGISTEAGIPDFRGPQGIWSNPELLSLISARGFQSDPAGFYRATLARFPNIASAKPTAAHKLLAQMEATGKLKAVITQNIDGLHQAAGSKTVYEIHGTTRTGHCTKCNRSFEMAAIYAAIDAGEPLPPLCPDCQWPIKPDTVLFDEMLPMGIWQAAQRAAEQCDLMLVLGSSLVVYPAANLPEYAIKNGARLIIVNLEPTDYDLRARVAIHCPLGKFAEAVMSSEYGL
jgi:NAD-dependent deacetylase